MKVMKTFIHRLLDEDVANTRRCMTEPPTDNCDNRMLAKRRLRNISAVRASESD